MLFASGIEFSELSELRSDDEKDELSLCWLEESKESGEQPKRPEEMIRKSKGRRENLFFIGSIIRLRNPTKKSKNHCISYFFLKILQKLV